MSYGGEGVRSSSARAAAADPSQTLRRAGTAPPGVAAAGWVIEVGGLGRAITDGWALEDATCRIGHGEFVAVVGASGSGKTTLLSLLGLLDRPSRGWYTFDGVDVECLTEAERTRLRGQRIGFVFQNSYLMADESVADNVSLPLRVRGIGSRARRTLVDGALRQVDLDGYQSQIAGQLSGGEKQRVAIARAIVGGPDVVLADEPTGALDTAASARLVDLLASVASRGCAVVVVTHDPLVATGAGRVIHLVDGRTTADSALPDTLSGLAAAAPPDSASVRWPKDEAHEPCDPQSLVPTVASLLTPRLARLGTVRAPVAATPADSVRRAEADVERVDDGIGPLRIETARRASLRRVSRLTRWAQELVTAALTPFGRPLRTGLVMLAYVLGVAALVGAIGLAQSATGAIVARLTAAASNEIRVTMTDADSPFIRNPKLPGGAVARVAGLPGVTLAVPVRTYGPAANPLSRTPGGDGIGFGGSIWVTETDYLDSYGLRVAQGTAALLSNDWGGAVAVLGASAAETLGVAAVSPGIQIWIGYRAINVTGILAPTGDTLTDDTVFMSRAAEACLTNWTSSYLLVRTAPGYAEPLARALPLILAPENPGSAQISTTSQLATLEAGISSDLSDLLGVLAWAILVLSALAAGATTLLSVHQRAPEIALRRAMGASRISIWRIFAYEGLLGGVAGGIFGGAAGAGLTWLMAQQHDWPTCLGTTAVTLGVTVGLLSGFLASAIPAVYAARRDPAQILRAV